MVRKNDASAIQIQTSLAFAKLSPPSPSKSMPTPRSAFTPRPRPSATTVAEALDAVCKLTGIGPATGTLILNVFDPVHIPFFQDEMFVWFFPNVGDKLKYTLKEYLRLLEAAAPVLEKLNVRAVELEQVAYVLGHVDVLDAAERQALTDVFKECEGDTGTSQDGNRGPDRAAEDGGDAKDTTTSTPRREPPPADKGRKRVAREKDEDDKGGETRAPKRRSQRKK
ncbi:uncharacterized protein A1O5_05466 [Cladophialophora psammophila CBS 110553]|uniref:ADA HAT complex component 1 n=1 Tax=Cladophialophora psammophila CBS 110553 TaxID=1182543 RepID=W9WUL0_9EURO|nr:uncharacterized protein A1O5_05466 [Cladophialophora psammophila CBS 110553]EXJ71658.1 hypothetical protein A1O5_05466 [Cladophialophora psammophila CBS 110553]